MAKLSSWHRPRLPRFCQASYDIFQTIAIKAPHLKFRSSAPCAACCIVHDSVPFRRLHKIAIQEADEMQQPFIYPIPFCSVWLMTDAVTFLMYIIKAQNPAYIFVEYHLLSPRSQHPASALCPATSALVHAKWGVLPKTYGQPSRIPFRRDLAHICQRAYDIVTLGHSFATSMADALNPNSAAPPHMDHKDLSVRFRFAMFHLPGADGALAHPPPYAVPAPFDPIWRSLLLDTISG